eukprot:gene14771-18047_t
MAHTEYIVAEALRRLASHTLNRRQHMQVLLNTDHHVDGRQEMADHLTKVVKEALHRFGDSITRVEAHLSDANSHVKSTPDEIHCTLEARVAGQEPIV